MKPREVRVVFDTNAIYATDTSELLSHGIATLIRGFTGHMSPALLWYLPETVFRERKFQMVSKGDGLLSHLQSAEKLLGRSLSVTSEEMQKGVEKLLEDQVKAFDLKVFPLDVSKVAWQGVVTNAIERRPPFESSKEKGFRDALVLETFMQVVAASPESPNLCRLVLVTNDECLALAASTRTQAVPNARVVSTLEDLKGYITTLEKEVDEKLVDALKPVAAAYFYVEDDSSCLYIRENVRKRIKEEHGDKLAAVPTGADNRENTGWRIDQPRFVDSQAKRITWASRVTVEAVALRQQPNVGMSGWWPTAIQSSSLTPPFISSLSIPSTGSTHIVYDTTQPFWPLYIQGGGTQPNYSVVGSLISNRITGRSVFEIVWSATVGESHSLTDGKVNSIKFVETTWDS